MYENNTYFILEKNKHFLLKFFFQITSLYHINFLFEQEIFIITYLSKTILRYRDFKYNQRKSI